MARKRKSNLQQGTSEARYPTLAEALLDRRGFLAGIGVATLGACFGGSGDDDVPLDGARPPTDAGPDSAPEIPDANYNDGVPPPPDAGPDAPPVDALTDALPEDASPTDAVAEPDSGS